MFGFSVLGRLSLRCWI